MCSHSWYDKTRRHRGPKPNTRRARGLPRRDKGVRRFTKTSHSIDILPEVEVDKDVKEVPLPENMKVWKRHIKMYNYYVEQYNALGRDIQAARKATAERFMVTTATIAKAVAECKWALVLISQG